MPTSINGTTFVYDYSGQRVKKNSTVYIGKLYECASGVCSKYYFTGDKRIAYRTGLKTYYYHADHLGSSSIITDETAAQKEEIYYYPYGKTRYNSGINLKHKFTGQEEDTETGLYYYGARYYEPTIGKFISADSIVPHPGNPQSLNRYSYVINNPLLYRDPTGHEGEFEEFNIFIVDPFWGSSNFISTPSISESDSSQNTILDNNVSSITMGGIGSQITSNQSVGNNPVNYTDLFGLEKTCACQATFTAVGPNQAIGIGALGISPPNDSVAISPAAFGLPYDTIAERLATQKEIIANIGNIQIHAPGLAEYLTGRTTFTIGDVGDRTIRNSLTTRFDIYRFATQKDALDFGKHTVPVTITGIPEGWSCPK